MSTAVLAEPKIDVESLERDIINTVSLISVKNLPRVKSLLDKLAEEEDAEYVPHSFEDFSPEIQQRFIDMENGIDVIGPVSFEEFVARCKEIEARVEAEMRAENAGA